MPDLLEYLDAAAARFEEELCELLRIPSVSADSTRRDDMHRAARWLHGQLQSLGLAAEVVETAGPPLVYAESAPVPGAPTVLVYGHYDVQPADPLEAWLTPPFEPTRRDGNVFARGATDDKGQLLTHVKSVEAWLAARGPLPLQIKFLIEGEEEIGSENLERYLVDHQERLDCDVVVISDTSQFGDGYPAITFGLRGIAYFELRLTGPNQDLHSGVFGGAVVNPVNALTQILSQLIDASGRIQVPGFYDDVVPLSERERAEFAGLPFDEAALRAQLDVEHLAGEVGYSTLERRWARPTFDIHGIWGGYQGEGGKTVLPCRAGAKFSFRLVPNQDPHRVAAALRPFLTSLCPPGARMELVEMHGAPGVLVALDSPFMTAAATAVERGFGRHPVFIREGGSIPIVTRFKQVLGVDTLLLGWGLEDDHAHGPNEKFSLADFHRGIRASAWLWEELSKIRT
jgi:succinyl-diaminopimelate desuccinylase